MPTKKKFPAWVLVCFCQVAHRASSRNAESRALGPINAYTRALGHRSRPCANSVRFFFSSPRKAAGGSVHVHGWLHWRCFAHMTVVTTTQEPRTKRSRGGGDIYTRQHRRVLQCSFRNRVRIGDNSGVHWSGGGGGDAVSVAEGGKGARRDGRGGGWWARATTARTWVLSRCRARQRRSLAAARRPAASSAPGRCRTSAQPVCDCCLVQCR